MNLALVLGKLGDTANRETSFQKAMQLDPRDPLIQLNYLIGLLRDKDPRARELYESMQEGIREGIAKDKSGMEQLLLIDKYFE